MNSLTVFFYMYIARRPYKGTVQDRVHLITQIEDMCVYISTRALKHMFDKKPAEEFHAVLDHLHLILMFPDRVYKNKLEKHGNICFVKRVKGHEYFCSLQIKEKRLEVVTCFRLRDPDYIKSYTLLWNRGSGIPHRHAIVFPEKPTDAPQ